MSASWGLFVWDIKPRSPRPMSPAWFRANKDKLVIDESPIDDPYGNEAADDYMLRRAIAAADYNRRHEPFGSR